MGRFEFFKDNDGYFRFELVDDEGNALVISTGRFDTEGSMLG